VLSAVEVNMWVSQVVECSFFAGWFRLACICGPGSPLVGLASVVYFHVLTTMHGQTHIKSYFNLLMG
jgi:hypothetical protein